MSNPKRHHWWPQFQSGHWTDEAGCITAIRGDGSTFRAPPEKLGVERELYTRYQLAGHKDLTIERWFSSEIERPFAEALTCLTSLGDIIPGWKIDHNPAKAREVRELGFKVVQHTEIMRLNANHRAAIDAYLAALLVRNPRYLRKLIAFHDDQGTPLPDALPRSDAIKTIALDNMVYVFELYRDQIAKSHMALLIAEGDSEFLFGDAGITAQEPWSDGPIPFTIHAPLTPHLAIEVLAAPWPDIEGLMVLRLTNQGTARMNRLTLSDCEQFVFCRTSPPLEFIVRNFGRAAPQPIGYRMKDGRLETHYDRSRDRS